RLVRIERRRLVLGRARRRLAANGEQGKKECEKKKVLVHDEPRRMRRWMAHVVLGWPLARSATFEVAHFLAAERRKPIARVARPWERAYGISRGAAKVMPRKEMRNFKSCASG